MRNPVLAVLLFLLVLVPPASGQTVEPDPQKAKAVKFDEFGNIGRCELRDRVNRFMTELRNKPGDLGYIINYSSIASADGQVMSSGANRR